MEKNVAKHVLADILLVTHGAKGEQEARLMYELLRRSYHSRQMKWHEECLLEAWEQYKHWLQSNSAFNLPAMVQSESHHPPECFYPIRLEKRGRKEWEFAWPSEVLNLLSIFNLACEHLENGNLYNAKRIFSSLINICPYFIDAYNHLATIEWKAGDLVQTEKHYSQAYTIGRSVLSANFKGQLPWGWVENRPFLRTIHGLALVKLRRGDIKSAQQLLGWLVRLEPNDNLGARAIIEDIRIGTLPWDD